MTVFNPITPKVPKCSDSSKNGAKGSPTKVLKSQLSQLHVSSKSGGILNNYYMYHGGTNFGHMVGGPYMTASYEYDAPLDEYGNLNKPKWEHFKQLHATIKLGKKSSPRDKDWQGFWQ